MKRSMILAVMMSLPYLDAAEKPKEQELSAYDKAISLANEFFYQPVLGNLTEKNATRMEIDKLCKLLTDKINAEMAKFIKIGQEAKAMQLAGADDKELYKKHIEMSEIYFSLKPAEPIVRMTYPKLHLLFDQLIELREKLDYSISDTQIITTEPEATVKNKEEECAANQLS
jgi:hypothetical protein